MYENVKLKWLSSQKQCFRLSFAVKDCCVQFFYFEYDDFLLYWAATTKDSSLGWREKAALKSDFNTFAAAFSSSKNCSVHVFNIFKSFHITPSLLRKIMNNSKCGSFRLAK